MTQEELQVLLEGLLKPSGWDIGISIATLLLTGSSIIVAIIVAFIYNKQSKIFKAQMKINQQQLELYSLEVTNKRFETVPNFILTTRLSRNLSDGNLLVEEFILRIPNFSRVKEVQKIEIEINGVNFPMKKSSNLEKASYYYKIDSPRDIVYIKGNYENGVYSVEAIVKITTIIFDEFEKNI